MDTRLQGVLRWLLVLIAVCASSFAAFILGMGLMLWPDPSIVAALSTLRIAPGAIIEAAHSVDFFLAILIWIVPPTSAIGYAAHTKKRRALTLGFSISILLFALLCFFLGRKDSQIALEWTAVIAALIVLVSVGLSFSTLSFPRMVTIANVIAGLLLFSPSAIALAHRTGAPPEAKALWSTMLQHEQWFDQSMNTGSEYAATRQVVLAADRVITVLDTGLQPTPASQGKWPNSNYRIVSLDAKTGARKNQIEFVGRWGAMPYIYATKSGQIDVQSDPPRLLNPDLTPSTASPESSSTATKPKVKQATCPNCDLPQYALADNELLQLQKQHFRVLDKAGRVQTTGNLIEWGSFAGSSADGRRFAIDSSYSEGDPDFLVYEFFTIYDVQTGKAIATIHVKDLPERQSWSAFSPDGRCFVAGNPNKLTMYLLPEPK